MIKRNPLFTHLSPAYLFPEIAARTRAFLQKNPQAELISLGVGDTSEPIPPSIAKAIANKAHGLAVRESYQGYGPEQGDSALRQQIAEIFYSQCSISEDEVFISDGAKTDLGRLQLLFGGDLSIAVQDPVYPAYVDASILSGKKIIRLPCTPSNQFFPDPILSADVYFICSPNNPTGVVWTRAQLKKFVEFCRQNQSLLVFDAAYTGYIQSDDYPRSIYEIPGADQVAIEVSSFSKLIGFTGIRLGWTVVPKSLKYRDGQLLHADWKRLISTYFNGASNLAQAGGLAVLSPVGLQEMQDQISFYCENAKILRECFKTSPFKVYGGDHAPYLWVHMGNKSWDVFHELLEKSHLITTPGVGFGPSGEGFMRLSAFGSRKTIQEAARRLKPWLQSQQSKFQSQT